MEPKTITNSQNLKRCVKSLQYYFLSGLFWLSGLPVQILSKNSGLQVAIRNLKDGLVAYLTLRVHAATVSIREGWTNKRLRTGFLIILMALPCWKIHRLFDVNTRIDDFYYVNFAFYFNNIKAYLIGSIALVGLFIALPQKWGFKWWLVPFFFLCVTEIYDRTFVYDEPLDFQQELPDWRVLWSMVLCIPAVFFSMDYLVYRKYHLKDGTAARIIGTVKMPNVPRDTKMDIMEQLVVESENFNARI